MGPGAPLGNNNPGKGKAFAGALRRVLAEAGTNREKLLEIADALVAKAMSGDVQAIKEIADRIDGKVPQALEHTGDGGGPMQVILSAADVGAL